MKTLFSLSPSLRTRTLACLRVLPRRVSSWSLTSPCFLSPRLELQLGKSLAAFALLLPLPLAPLSSSTCRNRRGTRWGPPRRRRHRRARRRRRHHRRLHLRRLRFPTWRRRSRSTRAPKVEAERLKLEVPLCQPRAQPAEAERLMLGVPPEPPLLTTRATSSSTVGGTIPTEGATTSRHAPRRCPWPA